MTVNIPADIRNWVEKQNTQFPSVESGMTDVFLSSVTGDEVSGGDGGYNGYKAERQSALAPPARFPCDQGRDFFEVK